ncbi:homogentisate 1,2-dioxygenase [Pseudobacteriovorax antillogorgiicola]|uniref:Homogentisate 1,2-dioxygenase n=1 Tax=Pseudobacteriovorax antillogorgiicola TaxID=1513793 RepID=A0A1Y6BNS2_9BACT|nr:homogentisate 1,2-dioxygenase [Pseudobacteriovorax antillogorgiicola]TCS53913.1 homogentisate 1,2-dioxygenase [Pseudobacteriovorax antillogorgiicola]SMF20633.1 homogentisate 1,2-dioxygenase [Pseudobacteriovorax antillogorgiicola]
MTQDYQYIQGFGNHISTEALPGALPYGKNSPQKPPYGLIPELLSGTAFTARRHENLRTWLYRIRPSVLQGAFAPATGFEAIQSAPLGDDHITPQQLRWDPMPKPSGSTHLIQGMVTVAANGDAAMRAGSAIHLYSANESMKDEYFYNSDGDLLIVPQSGELLLKTEFGTMSVEPTEIAMIPRGVKFQAELPKGDACGYMLEIYGNHMILPDLGPIGSNGLANPRDFQSPVAAYEERSGDFQLLCKYGGKFFTAAISHSPLDVVAWHGNYAPYKYDLKLFNTINTVSYDHPDPSIFTVLTSPSEHPGCANVDFVIFPPRWMVAEDTFRPPYYHRNVMSEYMGLIHGAYDAKPDGGFEPGGGSLHSCMAAHGPEAKVFDRASDVELKPEYQGNTLAFMFESSYIYKTTAFAMDTPTLQEDYHQCWQGLKPRFDPKKP